MNVIYLTIEELKTIIYDSVSYALAKEKPKSNSNQELMTRHEVASYYKISLVSLRKWVKQGILPKPIKKASRVYFIKSQIQENNIS